MSGSDSILSVYLGQDKIAQLELKDDQLHWQYEIAWQEHGYPVSPHLPLHDDIPTLNVARFLRNLFPEGRGLDTLLDNFHLSKNNTFGLVRALGLDMPGAVMMLGHKQSLPCDTTFRFVSEVELAQRLNDRESHDLIMWDGKPRLSVAGIQEKINLVVNEKGQLGFGEGGLCSTHILKFEKHRSSHLVLNEYVSLQLAKRCGLAVASSELRTFGEHRALLVSRFDRKWISSTTVMRRHMIDGCQALNLPPEYKYERNFGSARDVAHIHDGASLKKLFDFTRHCDNPALTKQQMLDWVLFNLLIFNFDAHGKNISFFIGAQGSSLTPFYDIVNVRLYPQFDQSMAMALGDEFENDNIHAYELAAFADNCGLTRQLVASRLQYIIERLTKALSDLDSIDKVNNNEAQFLLAYKAAVAAQCAHFKQQCALITKI